MFRIFRKRERLISKNAQGEPEHKDVGPEIAYALGTEHAKARERIGGPEFGVFVILPEAIRHLTGQPKAYDELTEYERKAVDWLYRVILPTPLHVVGYPQPMGPFHAARIQTYISKRALEPQGADQRANLVGAAAAFLDEAVRQFKAEDFPTYDLGKASGVKALKASNDPQVLHHALVACFAYIEDKKGVLDWVIAHPALDRGTAGWALCYLGLDAWMELKGSFHHSFMDDDKVRAIVLALCVRSQETGFSNDAIGLDEDPAPIIAGHREFGLPDDTPWPKAIFGAPFAPYASTDMRYEATEEGVVRPI